MENKMINKIDGVILIVSDLHSCISFYRDILGMKIKLEEKGFVEFETTNKTVLALMALDEAIKLFGKKNVLTGDKMGRRLELATEVEDVDSVYKRLKQKGVKFIREPVTMPWGQRTADFVDPEGNIWEIYKPL